MDASMLKGRAIVSLTEGIKVGTVAQPLFDLQLLHLVALEITGEGGVSFIPFDQVQNIGPDVITVASQRVIAGGTSATLIELDQVMKLKVIDQAGTFLGTIAHVDIDPASGRVVRVAAHKGGVLGVGGTTAPIDPATILSIGPDLMTLATDAALPVA